MPLKRSVLPSLGLLALIWGSSFLWIELADRGFSPAEVTFGRLALGAIVLFPVVLARREALPRSARLWGQIAAAALFANAAPYLLFAMAERTVDSSTAGIINATTPLWTMVLAVAVRHQRDVGAWQTAGLVVGFAGATLIFSPWHAASSLVSAGGLECLTASVSYAISYIYMDRYLARRGISPIALAACQLLAATGWLALSMAVTGARVPQFSAVGVAGLAVLGVLGTGVAYVLNYQIIASEGATIASTVTYLLPVVAITLGVLVLSENMTPAAIGGTALVLLGVALTRRRKQRAAPAPAAASDAGRAASSAG
jgi:drug/metabolite transporter (DMT)-like permease